MRVTRILKRILDHPGKLAPGKIDTGKNKIYPTVKNCEIRQARKLIEETDRNILLLRHPYLPIKETFGYEDDWELSRLDQIRASDIEAELEKHEELNPPATIEARYSSLLKSHSWDA